MKLKPRSELPYAEGEKFLEVMPLDRRAGVRPVQERGSSDSSGPAAMSDDVEESAPVKKLVAPPRQRMTGSSTQPVQDLAS